MIELLAPAGDLEKLKIALLYGADAVFIGGEVFSLRARASNFNLEKIKEALDFTHSLNKKLYVTTNIIPHIEDYDGLLEYLQELDRIGVDAIISASPYIIDMALKNTNLEVHLSTQQSTMNQKTVNFWYEHGVKRIVLARELSKYEIRDLAKNVEADIEVFIHGGMCMSYSGRCSLSDNFTNRDANRGGCAHSCRWKYELYKNNIKFHDEPFSMSSKDLESVSQVPYLIKSNVKSLKIEGRMKSLHYIATVVSTYRRLIDDYNRLGKITDYTSYIKEIEKAENRLTSFGFLEGKPTINEQLFNNRSEQPNKLFIGLVLEYDANKKQAIIEQRNFFNKGDYVEVFFPNGKIKDFQITKMTTIDNEELLVARHPKQKIVIDIPFEVVPYAIIRSKS